MDLTNLPDAIEKLPTTPIGVVSLIILLLAVVALIFFRNSDSRVKLPIFVLLFVGAGGVVYSILQQQSQQPPPPPPPAIVVLDCTGVDLSITPGTVGYNVWWCGSPGATRTIVQQARFDPTPSCIAYAKRDFANLTQNQLFDQAKLDAKADKYDVAFEMIDACQCHSPNAQAQLKEGRRIALCYLKAS